jgi:hypothetical protein
MHAEFRAMAYANYSPHQVESRAREIYERQLRAKIEAGNHGKFVVIDVDSADYDVDADDLEATKRLLGRRPDAVIFGLRIGYPTAYTLGGQTVTDNR